MQTKSLTCTDELYRLFGLDVTPHERSYGSLLALVHEKDELLIKQAIGQALEERKVTRIDFSITHPDGTVRVLEATGQVRENESGEPIKLLGTVQDISLRKEHEKALIKREEQYHFIVEAVPAMIWMGYSDDKMEDDKMDFVNTWMVNYTGLPAGKLLESGCLEAVHPDDREAIIAAQASSFQSRKPYQIKARFRRGDGMYRWHIRHALPFKDDQGKVTKWIGINVDIHEQVLKEEALQENEALREAQQKLQAEKEFSENILENSINGIMAFDSNGRITKWNKYMEFLSGKEREQAIGMTLHELFPRYADGEEGKAIRQALEGQKVTLRNYNNAIGLEGRFYELNLLPLVADSKTAGGLGIIYDVTEIVKLEQAQTNLKLGQQKESLNAILRAQERERERISESLHNGIGQLLFALKLNLQILNSKPLQPDSKAILTRVNEFLNEAIRQSRTVSFELVPTILKDFGLEATLEDLAQTLSSPALTIGVQVTGLEKRPEKFLELTIFRIIQALLTNVIEHSKAREAMVRVSKEENTLSIRVRDNGKGFDPQTATATVKENSLQTISNRVALLNGKLTIDSAMGKGTTVRVTLPLPQ